MTADIRKNIEDIFELTSMQQGMLFHTLYNEGSDAYIEQFILDLEGEMNSELFKKAWQYSISRHQALRASFRWKGIQKPVQIIEKEVDIIWKEDDWSTLSKGDAEEKFISVRGEDRRNLFDMEKAPLMRFHLIKLTASRYRLLWTFHHILMDGWSYPVIIGDVMRAYESYYKDLPPEEAASFPYKNYILWLSKQDKNAVETYWRAELSGFINPSHFKTSSASVEKPESFGSQEGMKFLPEEFTGRLVEFARANRITLSTLMQAAWAFVVSAYSGERDVIFGGTVSGRPAQLQNVEKIVGLFINTLPVRIRINKDQPLGEWLSGIQSKYSEREQYSYGSLADIQTFSELPANTKLFDNILVFENYPSDPALIESNAHLRVADISAFEKTNYPLAVLVAPGKRLKLTIAYDENEFDDTFAEGLLGSIEGALASIISPETKLVGDISLLIPEKAEEILFDWNETSHDYPAQQSVKCFYEALTTDFTDKTALEFGDFTMSYRELNDRSNKLANYLLSIGIKEGEFVGISMERSPEMVIALLAVIKSGAAYLPLDRSYPGERIEYMIEDSGIRFIISKDDTEGKLPETQARIVNIDNLGEELNSMSMESPAVSPGPQSPVYMIYTSGSTGRPKGVIMHNIALVNLLNWQLNGQTFERGLTTLQFTTLSFDVSFQEIFSTLMSGGKLVIMSEEQRKDLREVLSIMKQKKVRRIFLPFIALQELAELQLASDDKELSLKEVMTAGEQLQNTPAIKALFSSLEDPVFVNQYGPTEAHVVTSYRLDGNPEDWPYNAPIGKPVFNTRMHILNDAMKPVPPGVTGDLYIGGVQVATGYHQKPDLTSEKFIKDIFSSNKTDRLYKTGDLARYMKDGNIEFLGRADNQIKFRGYRIELGEIESVLNSSDKVKASAVVIRSSANGERRIVSYIVLREAMESSGPEMRKFLAESLPEFMIPSDYVFLKELPLLPSGKVDIRSLPEPEKMSASAEGNYEEPGDELELQLVQIWEKVLGLKKVGITDDFFELGGHSLLALRLFGYIEKLTGRKLAISTLFSHPTIKQLAGILRNEGWKPPWKSLVAVKPGGSRLPFFCVPPGAGTALHFQGLVKYLSNEQPFYVLESVGLDGKEPPHDNIEEMAAHYVKEIRMLQPDGPYMIGGRCFGGRVVFEMAQQFMKQGQEVALLAIFDTWPPFRQTPKPYVPPKRDLGHFIKSASAHLKSGDLMHVVRNYTSNKWSKTTWKIKNNLKYYFSDEKKRLYNRIMLLHFAAQDRYVAKKYPGKITLIECSTFKKEFRDAWEELAGGGFETYVVPDTDHKTIVREPKIRDFAEKLNYVLEKTHTEIVSKNRRIGKEDHKSQTKGMEQNV